MKNTPLYKYGAFGNIILMTQGLWCFSLGTGRAQPLASPFCGGVCPSFWRRLPRAGSCQELPVCDVSADSSTPQGARAHLLLPLLQNRRREISKRYGVTLAGALSNTESIGSCGGAEGFASASLALPLRKAALNPLLTRVKSKSAKYPCSALLFSV